MLTDNYFRHLDYLRVSVTDKCNLRCTYCMPEGIEHLDHDKVLRLEEFIYLIGIFAELGIKKVRFTGGEPLVRRGFIDIVSGVRKDNPDLDICITTNGILLNDFFSDLIKLNVRKLNISLDSITRDGFLKITRGDFFDRVISNIEKALEFDFFEIKVNTVLHDNVYNELDGILDYFKDKKVKLRFIEKMPFSSEEEAGKIKYNDFLSELEKRGKLTRNNPVDTRVAKMYDFLYKDKYRMQLGVIPPISHSFCAHCNRLRLTCDGFLRTCLHSEKEYDLKTPLRMNAGKDMIEKLIHLAVAEKPGKHNLDSNSPRNSECFHESVRTMSKIGG